MLVFSRRRPGKVARGSRQACLYPALSRVARCGTVHPFCVQIQHDSVDLQCVFRRSRAVQHVVKDALPLATRAAMHLKVDLFDKIRLQPHFTWWPKPTILAIFRPRPRGMPAIAAR